jgi:hypothetical protein
MGQPPVAACGNIRSIRELVDCTSEKYIDFNAAPLESEDYADEKSRDRFKLTEHQLEERREIFNWIFGKFSCSARRCQL